MKDHLRELGLDFEIRGPLTVAEVEEELAEFYKELAELRRNTSDSPLRIDDIDLGEAWRRLKSTYRDGDELYFFTSDESSWAEFNGMKGYVIVRQNQFVDWTVIAFN